MQIDTDIVDFTYFDNEIYIVGSPSFSDESTFDDIMRRNIDGVNIQKTIFVISDTNFGTSGLMKLWCHRNDGRYRVVDPIMFDDRINAYRPSLLPFKGKSAGLIFLGEDKFSKEYRLHVAGLKNKKEILLSPIDLGSLAPASKMEIAVIDPYQIRDYNFNKYKIIHIGLQRYTFDKARSHIPFLPDARWIDYVNEDQMSLEMFRDQYKNRLRNSQRFQADYWANILEYQKLAICNYRDVHDYDYSMDFANELLVYLERHWMDANINNAQYRGV